MGVMGALGLAQRTAAVAGAARGFASALVDKAKKKKAALPAGQGGAAALTARTAPTPPAAKAPPSAY